MDPIAPVSLEDIGGARGRIAGSAIRTPLVRLDVPARDEQGSVGHGPGAELFDGALGILAHGAYPQDGPLGSREAEDGEDAGAAHPLVPAAEGHLRLEASRHRREPTGGPGMEAELRAHGELLLHDPPLAHTSPSGTSSLATEMLRWP